MEAGCVAGGEKLLRVGSFTVATEFHGAGECYIQFAVIGAGVAIAAFAGGKCLSSVESLHGVSVSLRGMDVSGFSGSLSE
ncbi:hypothetical protein D3C85_1831260 [compost metagenome]